LLKVAWRKAQGEKRLGHGAGRLAKKPGFVVLELLD
jgi:hypothetical protein